MISALRSNALAQPRAMLQGVLRSSRNSSVTTGWNTPIHRWVLFISVMPCCQHAGVQTPSLNVASSGLCGLLRSIPAGSFQDRRNLFEQNKLFFGLVRMPSFRLAQLLLEWLLHEVIA